MSGSTVEIEAVFERYHASLFRYLHRLVGDADVAADLTQESFVRLLERPVDAEKVRGWLFTVGTNLVRDRARSRSRRRKLLFAEGEGPDRPVRPDEEYERARRIGTVRRALGRLPDRDRELLLMREEGFRYAEIAKVIGVAPGSVGTLLARALSRFATEMDAAGEES